MVKKSLDQHHRRFSGKSILGKNFCAEGNAIIIFFGVEHSVFRNVTF